MAADRQLQKLVVLRITAGGNALADLHQLGRHHQFMQPIEKMWRDQWREARPGQGDKQLALGDCGFEEKVACCREMNRGLRRRSFL